MIHNKLRPEAIFLLGPIATHAVSHDVTECVTGDIVRTFKYSDTRLLQAIREAEARIITTLPNDVIGVLKAHVVQLEDQKALKELGYVETVVKMADFMSLWSFMRRELLRGNREIKPFYDRMIVDLDLMRSSFVNVDLYTIGPQSLYQQIAEFYFELTMWAANIRNQVFR